MPPMPEAGTRFGPAGSLFHALQPGETLADARRPPLRRRRAASAACRRPMRRSSRGGAPGPGLVLRIPPKP